MIPGSPARVAIVLAGRSFPILFNGSEPVTHYVVYAQGKVHLVKKSLSCTQDEVIGELARLCRVPPVSIVDYVPLSGDQMRMGEMELRRIYGGLPTHLTSTQAD